MPDLVTVDRADLIAIRDLVTRLLGDTAADPPRPADTFCAVLRLPTYRDDRPWVARLSRGDRGIERTFIRGRVDYSDTRGDTCFILDPGRLYEVGHPTRRGVRRYLCRAENGVVVTVEDETAALRNL